MHVKQLFYTYNLKLCIQVTGSTGAWILFLCVIRADKHADAYSRHLPLVYWVVTLWYSPRAPASQSALPFSAKIPFKSWRGIQHGGFCFWLNSKANHSLCTAHTAVRRSSCHGHRHNIQKASFLSGQNVRPWVLLNSIPYPCFLHSLFQSGSNYGAIFVLYWQKERKAENYFS